MKRAFAVIVALLAFAVVSCNRAPQAGSTVVLIVRHAEKASEADDSPLTDVGAQRAQELARVAADAGVSAIYTTQFVRNRETARPLAERLGIAVTEVPVNLQAPGDYGKTLARQIVEQHPGQTVLVVGHSNTIASIIEGLTGRSPQTSGVEYQDLFIVTLPPSGPPHVIKAQYGLKPAN
jgi:broad specificity phosphatase PhoE